MTSFSFGYERNLINIYINLSLQFCFPRSFDSTVYKTRINYFCPMLRIGRILINFIWYFNAFVIYRPYMYENTIIVYTWTTLKEKTINIITLIMLKFQWLFKLKQTHPLNNCIFAFSGFPISSRKLFSFHKWW